MLMTDSEAGSKFCGPYRSARNPEGYGGVSDYCNGSNCMMWRWTGPAKYQGYCGLAGKPVC